jgi:hypothetical protein
VSCAYLQYSRLITVFYSCAIECSGRLVRSTSIQESDERLLIFTRYEVVVDLHHSRHIQRDACMKLVRGIGPSQNLPGGQMTWKILTESIDENFINQTRRVWKQQNRRNMSWCSKNDWGTFVCDLTPLI